MDVENLDDDDENVTNVQLLRVEHLDIDQVWAKTNMEFSKIPLLLLVLIF